MDAGLFSQFVCAKGLAQNGGRFDRMLSQNVFDVSGKIASQDAEQVGISAR